MTFVYFILAALLGYLIGSIPNGYILVRLFKGEDLTKIQSGRTGGTNTFRAAGARLGVMTVILDGFKGAGSVWLSRAIFANALDYENLMWATAIAAVCSVIGHNWSIFLGFKGGAGAATNAGWALALWWPIFPILVVFAVAMFYFIGMASVMTQLSAVFVIFLLAIRSFIYDAVPYQFVIGAVVSSLFIAWSLRPNFKRILEGNERVVGPRAKRIEKRKAKQENKDSL